MSISDFIGFASNTSDLGPQIRQKPLSRVNDCQCHRSRSSAQCESIPNTVGTYQSPRLAFRDTSSHHSSNVNLGHPRFITVLLSFAWSLCSLDSYSGNEVEAHNGLSIRQASPSTVDFCMLTQKEQPHMQCLSQLDHNRRRMQIGPQMLELARTRGWAST
ncbi:hypothetical protein BC629DRAFT_871555 [Irpex lacteus]|nr:hypothetical protein BC629DRAFT_871555 [Irpex lacteus]